MSKTLLIFIFTFSVFAQGLPWHLGARGKTASRGGANKFAFKFEVDIGHTQIDFSEIHESQNFLDTIFTQTSIRYRTKGEFMLIPGWITLGASFDYTAPTSADVEQTSSVDTGGCCEVQTTDAKTYAIVYVPTRPVNLAALVEYVYSDIGTSSNAYGHTTAEGMQYGFLMDLTADNGTSIYAKWYPWKSVSDREEINAGVQFVIGGKEAGYPYSLFKSGMTINFDYRQIILLFEGVRDIKIERKELTASIGFRF